MPTYLLVTGFGAFGELVENPTETAMKRLAAGPGIATHVFRTSVAAVRSDLPRLLSELEPKVVVLFGYSGSATEVRLETTARNGSGTTPDVDGQLLPDEVVPGGPAELGSTLPLAPIERALGDKAIRSSYSEDAGGYLCNFSFYLTQHLAPSCGVVASGFIHLPSAESYEEAHGSPLDHLVVVEAVASLFV